MSADAVNTTLEDLEKMSQDLLTQIEKVRCIPKTQYKELEDEVASLMGRQLAFESRIQEGIKDHKLSILG